MSRSVNTSPSVPCAANYCSIAITRFAMRDFVADQSVARARGARNLGWTPWVLSLQAGQGWLAVVIYPPLPLASRRGNDWLES
jgi:hypothetical protein